MSDASDSQTEWTGFRERWRKIIFYSDTPGEKLFDVVLIIAILISVLVVMLESVGSIRARYGHAIQVTEWIFTGLFTVEYVLRLYVSLNPLRYARSFFGVIDLLSILPSFVALMLPGAHYLMSIRAVRFLRIFRILKMVQFVGEANQLQRAMRQSTRKIMVFIFCVMTLVCILGSLMYLIEGAENGFTSIPRSIYWAIVTLTTVGYGDVSPGTTLGQFVASMIMIVGYGIIAVPTGIVTAEITRVSREGRLRVCLKCQHEFRDDEALHCKFCGGRLAVREIVDDGLD